ncbi:HEAT repeat domain-containing protein, partial [bacterium]|nr:HEAT repeat domain-containing protein [bacterium]
KRIDKGESLRETYEKKKADLFPGDPEPRYALAQWCKEQNLAKEQRELLEEVIRLSPDHAEARKDLGYVKDNGAWITEADLRKKLGFEKVNGVWVTAAEAKKIRRSGEVRKTLISISMNLAHAGASGAQARAALDALAKDDADLVAPLVEERLGDTNAEVRRSLVELLGKLKQKSSAARLAQVVLDDADRSVRQAAAAALWATADVPARTDVVQALFHRRSQKRDRAAEALVVVADPETVPYLIEGLYIRVERTVEVDPDDHVILRGGSGAALREGAFGGYHEEEAARARQSVYHDSSLALAALKKITGRDFDYSKGDWWSWWQKEGRAKLLPERDAKK